MLVSNDFAHEVFTECGLSLGHLVKKENGGWDFMQDHRIKLITARDSSIITDALFKANGIVRKVEKKAKY